MRTPTPARAVDGAQPGAQMVQQREPLFAAALSPLTSSVLAARPSPLPPCSSRPCVFVCFRIFFYSYVEYQWTQFVFDPWPHKKELPLFMDSCIIMTVDWNCTVTNYSVDHFNLKYFVVVCRHICKSYFSSLPLNIAQNQYGYLINTK